MPTDLKSTAEAISDLAKECQALRREPKQTAALKRRITQLERELFVFRQTLRGLCDRPAV